MKRVYYTNEKDLEGLKWVAKTVNFGVSLSVVSVINEMYSALCFLREDTGLFRKKVKTHGLNAINGADARLRRIRANMSNAKFWDEYSDTVIDLAGNDITLFRIAIKQALDDAGREDALLISYVECARVLLDMSVTQFDCIMEDAKEKFGRDYSKEFGEYRLGGVLLEWEKMCDELYKGIAVDLNKPSVQGLFERMCRKFADGEYVDGCLKAAVAAVPDFKENVVVVKEGE